MWCTLEPSAGSISNYHCEGSHALIVFCAYPLQEDAYVEFLRIRKVPIEERPKSTPIPDVVPLVCTWTSEVDCYSTRITLSTLHILHFIISILISALVMSVPDFLFIDYFGSLNVAVVA